jgi:hypothetical protein
VLNATNEQTVWSLRSNVAELGCGYLSGRIDVARPDAGLHGIVLFDALPAPAQVFGVHRVSETNAQAVPADGGEPGAWPLPVAEAYVRGNDLVAGYKPVSDWPFSPQLYWQMNTLRMVTGALASMSLMVSVQTHLLDTCPQIGVASQLPSGELFLFAISDSGRRRVELIDGYQRFFSGSDVYCVVMRPQNWQYSYIEVMAPSDFRDLALRSEAGRMSSEWQLFADFLEKGVIRRARVHAAFLPRENDLELAAACCEATRQLELPLTT